MASVLLLRQRVLDHVDDFVSQMIQSPTLDKEGNVHQEFMLRDLQLVGNLFESYVAMVRAYATTTSFSQAIRNLQDDELITYRGVKHKLDLLWSLYSPKSES